MRKPNNNRKPSGGKSFKPRESGGAFKKASASRSKEEGRPYSERRERSEDKPDRPRRASGDAKDRKPFGKGPGRKPERPARDHGPSENRKPFGRGGDNEKPAFKPRRTFDSSEKRPLNKDFGRDQFSREKGEGTEARKPYKRGAGEDKADFKPKRTFAGNDDKKPFGRNAGGGKPFKRGGDSNARKYGPAKFEEKPERSRFNKKEEVAGDLKRVKFDDFEDGKVFSNAAGEKPGKKPRKTFKKQGAPSRIQTGEDGMIRLNKYLSNAGIASRREADTLIQSGVVKVNGVVVDQLGTKINPGDKVTYSDAPVRGERKVYILLNKPKDYITTTDDPQERKTVMELIAKACKERVYPVGRLDRNTTGLLLLTNDGEMTAKLTHPKFGIKKVYHVSLNKGLKPDDFKAISEGLELEDGIIKADDIAFVGEGKKEIGIEIHSGRNRIVRRIFEHLGYDVLKLDRVVFAGLTKKDLPRGKHRFLTAKEIGFLQMIG